MAFWTKLAGAGALALVLTTPALAQEEDDFLEWDSDGDEMWNEDEWGVGFGANYAEWDEDQDGVLSQDEFNAGGFRAYDEDGDGFLNADEQAGFMEDDGLGFWNDEDE